MVQPQEPPGSRYENRDTSPERASPAPVWHPTLDTERPPRTERDTSLLASRPTTLAPAAARVEEAAADQPLSASSRTVAGETERGQAAFPVRPKVDPTRRSVDPGRRSVEPAPRTVAMARPRGDPTRARSNPESPRRNSERQSCGAVRTRLEVASRFAALRPCHCAP